LLKHQHPTTNPKKAYYGKISAKNAAAKEETKPFLGDSF